MALTATAQRIVDTLPFYWHGEPLLERMIQAQANEIDRIDALLDQLQVELQPGGATDSLGLLTMWEKQLGLPPAPAGISESQRHSKLLAVLQAIGAGSSADVLSALDTAADDAGAIVVLRDTPDALQDTLVVPFLQGSYLAGQVEAIARRAWPAHRGLLIRFENGFLFDISRLDVDSL